MNTLRILHVDHDSLKRSALKIAFNQQVQKSETEEIKIVESLASGEEAMEACKNATFDLVVMAAEMPFITGYEIARKILKNNPEQKILLISLNARPENLRKSIKIGVSGHISKGCTLEVLNNAIDQVLSGKKFYDSSTMMRLFHGLDDEEKKKLLDKRDMQLLKLICAEYTRKEMAGLLNCSIRTVDNHIKILFDKINVRTAVGLAVFAFRNGLA